MNEIKECFKCHRVLPLAEFYKHPRMKDGHLNKCKDCTKRDVNTNYEKHICDSDFVEKERARGREKYKRLGYRDMPSRNKEEKYSMYPKLRNARQELKCSLPPDKELHRWNYNDNTHLIVLDRRLHHRLHTAVSFNLQEGIYYKDNRPLDTIDKHLDVIKDVCDNNGFDFNRVYVL